MRVAKNAYICAMGTAQLVQLFQTAFHMLAVPMRQQDGMPEGIILTEARGDGGFGYDPVFYVPAYDKTYAELSAEEKNQISHRARALQSLKEKQVKLHG